MTLSNKNKELIIVFAIIMSLSVVLSYNYFTFIELPNMDSRIALQQQILDGTAVPPYNYRILVPALTNVLADVITFISGISFKSAFSLSYIIYNIISLSLFLMTLYIFLKQWHDKALAIIGTLFCAVLLPISLRDHYFQPWSLIEAWFFVMAMYATYRRKYPWLVLITIFASLNRNTGIFIPLIYLFGSLDFKSLISNFNFTSLRPIVYKFAFLLSISILLILTVRIVQGGEGHIATIPLIFEYNTKLMNLIIASIHLLLFAGAWWFFAISGIKYADKFTVQLLMFIPFYLTPVIIFGIWKEVRMLLPIYPIIISLGLFYLKKTIFTNDK